MTDMCAEYAIADGVATITMNRPEALNAFNSALRRDLLALVRRAEGDPAVRVVVLRGSDRAFSVGADLKESYSPPYAQIEGQILEEYKPVLDAIATSAKTYIAAVRGPAAGIGLSFALNCDLMLMAEDAYLYLAFAPIALVPDGGATWHLVHALGYKRAFEAIADGRKISAVDCVALGLANHRFPHDGFDDVTHSYAQALAKRAPLALRYSKQIARNAMSDTLDATIRLEARLQNITMASADAREAVDAFFNKRVPVFRGC